jgi:DNA replication protein DnaC
MWTEQTLEKLHRMRLTGMAEALERQLEDPDMAALSFEERLAWLVDRHWIWRENQALTRRLKNARLRDRQAAVEDIDFRHPRGLDRAQVRSLASCDWVARHQNLIIVGPCGVGKTFLACAFAQKAVREGYTARYCRLPQLIRELSLARADGSLDQKLRQLARIEVLILDDWLMLPVGPSERRDLLEIAEDRYQTRSTILTSQIPLAAWHEQIGDPTLADSILDRLVHQAHQLELKGESLRKSQGRQTLKEKETTGRGN